MLKLITFIFGSFVSLVFISECHGLNFIKENVTLTVPQGKLFGEKLLDFHNKTFYGFKGIPFAKSPTGALRFKAPETAEPWTGIYDATQVRPICPQLANTNMVQDENCLFLNIYTKMANKLKPVMVWIFGGGLQNGHIFNPSLSPQFLIGEDIVLVYVSHRLSIFGFLSIDDDPSFGITGNAGFKDVIMALKWVQKNIEYFGGDPQQVTVFGESSGAAIAHLLYFSPMAKGLFHKIIAESGVATNPFMTTKNKYPHLAQVLNCNTSNLAETVDCINRTTTNDMLRALKILQDTTEFRTGETTIFSSLTIENKNIENSFITEYPDETIARGTFNDVPIIMGLNSDEGALFFHIHPIKPNFTDYESLIPKDIVVVKGSNESVMLGKKIKEFYYGDSIPSYDLVDPFIDYVTDTKYLQKAGHFAKLHTSVGESKIFFYHFNYATALNGKHNLNTTRDIVTHGDELNYLFYDSNKSSNYLNPTSNEYIGNERMVKLWTTFAKSKNGDPNLEDIDPLLTTKWLPMDKDKFNYLLIQPNLEMHVDPLSKRLQFWQDIYSSYNITTI